MEDYETQHLGLGDTASPFSRCARVCMQELAIVVHWRFCGFAVVLHRSCCCDRCRLHAPMRTAGWRSTRHLVCAMPKYVAWLGIAHGANSTACQ